MSMTTFKKKGAMKKSGLIFFGSCLILVTSCNKEESYLNITRSDNTITIIANATLKGADTKLTFDDDEAARVLYVDWKNSGERFSVVRGGENTTFTQTASTDDDKNIFEGSCPDVEGSGTYYAIYPYNESLTDLEAVPYDLSLQTGALDETKTYMYASADAITDGSELDFRQMTAILKPQFGLQDGEKVHTVILTLPEGSYSKGTFNVTDQSISPDSDEKREIKVFSNNSEDVYIYLPAIESTGTESISVELHTSSSMYVGSIQLSKSIKAGKLYEVSSGMTLEENAEFVWKSGISTVAPSGSGTEADPYLISNAANLQWLLNRVNDNEDEDNNPTLNEHYKLTHNLVINSSESTPWIPIGKDRQEWHKFSGIFDGHGYIISGTLVSQYKNTTLNDWLFFGFFGGLASDSHIKNMTLNLNVTGGNTFKQNPNSGSPKFCSTGIIAGRSNGLIENCTTYGEVKGGRADGSPWDTVNPSHTGGIVGLNIGTIKNSTNYSNVKGNYGNGNGGSITGGIVGKCGLYYGGTQKGYIESCINYGSVTGGDSGGSTGGIAGSVRDGDLKSNINYGEVSSIDGNQKAGIAGVSEYGRICTCNKDYSSLGTIIGNGKTPEQIDGCTGNHS